MNTSARTILCPTARAARPSRAIGTSAALAALASIAALASLTTGIAPAVAQPAAPATPPMRADTRLAGNLLATLTVESAAQCLAECRRVAGCSGFSFSTAAVKGTVERGGLPPLPGRPGLPGAPGSRLPNCSLLSGALSEAPAAQIVSCRMPCEAGGPSIATPGRVPGTVAPMPPVARLPLPPQPQPMPPVPMQDGTANDGKPPKPGTATPTPPGTPVPVTAGPIIAPPQPPLQLARSGVRGWEVVTGAPVQVAPLSSATAVAQCPQGKVAISTGYLTQVPQPDANYGLEVRGAIPEGDVARVFLRNANVGRAVTLRAQAVCITPMAGLRAVDIARQQIGDRALRLETVCQPNERVIGGGAMASIDALLPANAPARRDDGAALWRSVARKASPLAGWQEVSRARVLCAPEHLVDGWELVTAPDALLGARSRADLEARCSAGARVLATGLQHLPPGDAVVFTTGGGDFGTPDAQAAEDGLSTQLQAAGGSSALASVLNRNTVGSPNSLRMRLTAICARPA